MVVNSIGNSRIPPELPEFKLYFILLFDKVLRS